MKARTFLLAVAAVAFPLVAFAQTDSDNGTAPRRAAAVTALPTALVTAFGVVSSTGAKLSGTPNWSSTYAAGQYTITIVNENYYYASYTTLVTPIGTGLIGFPGYCKTDSLSGKLLVKCYDKGGNVAAQAFAFRVEKY